MRPTPSTRGFTLIELMITVAIVAILAAIAYPSYKQFILKGRRAEGRAALMAVLQQQERYFTQYNTYWVPGLGLGPNPFKAYSGDNASTSAYQITSQPCATEGDPHLCVQIQASPNQPDPEAGVLTLTSVGPTKGCDGAKPEVCWK